MHSPQSSTLCKRRSALCDTQKCAHAAEQCPAAVLCTQKCARRRAGRSWNERRGSAKTVRPCPSVCLTSGLITCLVPLGEEGARVPPHTRAQPSPERTRSGQLNAAAAHEGRFAPGQVREAAGALARRHKEGAAMGGFTQDG